MLKSKERSDAGKLVSGIPHNTRNQRADLRGIGGLPLCGSYLESKEKTPAAGIRSTPVTGIPGYRSQRIWPGEGEIDDSRYPTTAAIPNPTLERLDDYVKILKEQTIQNQKEF